MLGIALFALAVAAPAQPDLFTLGSKGPHCANSACSQNLHPLTPSPCKQGEGEPESLVGCSNQRTASANLPRDVDNAGQGPFRVYIPKRPTVLVRLAAHEIRRYLYLRTGVLTTIVERESLPAAAVGVVLGGRQTLLIRSLGVAVSSRSADAYRLKTIRAGKIAVVAGASDVATLYGAYAFAEKLGVRFYLHGDTIPDDRIPLRVPDLDETRSPLFGLRGIQPFHDFPEGPDWWSKDDYLAVIGQLPKLKMNFIGLHTYPDPVAEPTVWIGLPGDVKPNGDVAFAYQSSYQNALRTFCGYVAKPTSRFEEGGSLLFDRDDFGNDVMRGLAPKPVALEDCIELFDRAGRVLNVAFREARALGVRTCLGTETPLTIPAAVKERIKARGDDPDSPAMRQAAYEGVFERIKRTHPLDYYWFWTPEGWTWGGNTQADVDRTVADIQAAQKAAQMVGAPFKLATCGWVLGPQSDRSLFDRLLPKDVAVSCINRRIGIEPVDPGFANVSGREKWAIPWMEDDGALTAPQLWVGRMRRDAQDALRYGCTGLMGIHWRTRILGPNVSALARAAWDQKGWPSPTQAPFEALGGDLAFYDVPIADADDPAVYRTVRWNLSGYRIRVPKGKCDVTLKFSELAYDAAGKRVFDVDLNGKRVVEALDVFAKVGKNRALDFTFRGVETPDGILRVGFGPRVEFPCIAAIVVKSVAGTVKVNCGGPAVGEYLSDLSSEGPRPGVSDFYLDWAKAEFGVATGPAIASLFSKLDGRLPRPLDWTNGPGGLTPDARPWAQVAAEYAFVDEFERIAQKISGAGSRSRFAYWLSNFEYFRAAARLRCAWFALEEAIKRNDSGSLPSAVQEVRRLLRLVRRLLIDTVSTPGEMGTLANWEQHNVAGPEGAIARAMSMLKAPAEMPATAYTGATRVIVPTVRTRIDPGFLNLTVIVLSQKPTTDAVLRWRPMGEGAYRSLKLKHIARGVYEVAIPAREDFEYYVKAGSAVWPATAPTLNQTVLVASLARGR
jgi:hypothetical protein